MDLQSQTRGNHVEAAWNAREVRAHQDCGADVFVARQPIFWANQSVMGYELVYRTGGNVQEAGEEPPETRPWAVMVDVLLATGLKNITGGHVAALNLPREVLLEDVAEFLDPKEVVIQLHKAVHPDPEVLSACKALAAQGFSLALDDFEFDPEFAPFLGLTHIVKVDVQGKSMEELKQTVDQLSPFELHLLAENVESEEVHEPARRWVSPFSGASTTSGPRR